MAFANNNYSVLRPHPAHSVAGLSHRLPIPGSWWQIDVTAERQVRRMKGWSDGTMAGQLTSRDAASYWAEARRGESSCEAMSLKVIWAIKRRRALSNFRLQLSAWTFNFNGDLKQPLPQPFVPFALCFLVFILLAPFCFLVSFAFSLFIALVNVISRRCCRRRRRFGPFCRLLWFPSSSSCPSASLAAVASARLISRH